MELARIGMLGRLLQSPHPNWTVSNVSSIADDGLHIVMGLIWCHRWDEIQLQSKSSLVSSGGVGVSFMLPSFVPLSSFGKSVKTTTNRGSFVARFLSTYLSE